MWLQNLAATNVGNDKKVSFVLFILNLHKQASASRKHQNLIYLIQVGYDLLGLLHLIRLKTQTE